MNRRYQLSESNPDSLLSSLKDRDQWLCWYSKPDEDGGFRKKPYPHDSECILYEPGVAKYSEPSNWLSYEEANEVLDQVEKVEGLGFILSEEDDFVLIDLDYCLDPTEHTMSETAKNIVDAFGSYTEISPSGRGLHLIVRGEIPRQGWTIGLDKNRVEVYNRFFATVTQNHISGTPSNVAANQSALDDFFSKHDIRWPDPKFTSFWPNRSTE